MNSTEQHLKRIQDKLRQLLKKHIALQKENIQLKKELSKGNQQVLQQQKNIDDLKQQLEVLKLSTANMNTADKKKFEKHINSYIKEIDRCIALLSN